MSDARTCTQCGRQMTTSQLWRKMMGQIGWRITCPSCGKVHDVATRERLVSALYFVVVPLLTCTVVIGALNGSSGHRAKGLLVFGAFVAVSMLGTWLAARRLRLA